MRALHLVRHGLADVVKESCPLGGLDAHSELAGHDPGEVADLERVLEDVLAVARSVAKTAEDLDELLVHLAACSPRRRPALRPGGRAPRSPPSTGRTSPRSGTGGSVRPRRASPSVSFAISRRIPSKDESTTACGVSSMMNSTPVRFSSARMLRPSRPMIAPLHVVRRQLDERDGRLRGVARSDPLERVGHEVAGALLRFGLRLLLDLAHHPGHLVPDELLRARRGAPGAPR